MVESDKNPTSETQIKAQKEEKKIIVHSPRGRFCSITACTNECFAPAFAIVCREENSHNKQEADYYPVKNES